MKKLWTKFITDMAPTILGILWSIVICCFSVGAAVWAVKFLLRMIGVL